MSASNKSFMHLAINLAESGIGITGANPSVGAVIVKNGKIISAARTGNNGSPHAEVAAINSAPENLDGTELFVTLEPCNHHGKNPPCVDAIIKSGIKKVFIANRDPNPKASGGSEKLKAAGIEVITGFCEKEAFEVNKAFFTKIHKDRPYIIIKVATSLDGKIAIPTAENKYITSETALNYAHLLRSRTDGILVGVNTIINDNPLLNCRLPGINKTYSKIILDNNLRTPENSNVIKNSDKEPVIIFSRTEGKLGNAEIIKTNNLKQSLNILAEKGFNSILVEGGGTVIASFIKENLVDEIHLIKSPKPVNNSLPALTTIPEDRFKIIETRNLGVDHLTVFKNNDQH